MNQRDGQQQSSLHVSPCVVTRSTRSQVPLSHRHCQAVDTGTNTFTMDNVQGCQLTAEETWRLHTWVWQQHFGKMVVCEVQGNRPAFCPTVQTAVLQVLGSLVCQAAPPSTHYITRLVKQLIIAAEETQQDFSEPLLELNTALLLGGATQQDESPWRYRTFYYSSNPSWHELQQLQVQHHQHIMSVLKPADQQQTAAECSGWVLPVQLQQRLLQRQQALQQLLSAAQLQQAADVNPLACPQAAPGMHSDQQAADARNTVGSSCSCNASEAAGVDHDPWLLPSSFAQRQGASSRSCGHSSSNPGFLQASRCSGLITVHSSANLFEGGTGCHMWDAGFLLAEFVLNNRSLFAGKRVLEVGCGPGLVATCLCRSGASKMLLTDGDPQTLVNCLSNLSMNGHRDSMLLGSWQEADGFLQKGQGFNLEQAAHQVLACPLDWHEDVPGLTADVVVGSDICYDPEAVPSLVRLLAQLLDCPTAAAVAAAAGGGCGAGGGDGEQTPPHTPRQQECSSSCASAAPSRPQRQAAADEEVHHAAAGQQQQQQQPHEVAREAAAAAASGPSDIQPVATSTAPEAAVSAAPVAYISTTKRQGSTLQLFLDLCQAAGLEVQELPKDPAVWARGCWGGSSSQCAGGAQAGGVAGCSNGADGGVEIRSGGSYGAVFQEVHALQQGEGRERYVLHRVVKRL